MTPYSRGFTTVCSMETSRIIRVGTGSNIIRVAAVSQEHVLVCTTRKVIRRENDMFLVLASKLTWLLCGGRNRRDFSVEIRIDLVFCGGQ